MSTSITLRGDSIADNNTFFLLFFNVPTMSNNFFRVALFSSGSFRHKKMAAVGTG